ncbi:siphovirus ReqiPepy6 Gp37-like family protein [Bacillus sp. CGMCC 1.16607]|uniref:siphovirus ReqiPepy6 Gp37-like family protein n=1 Tax=Bacillus sp. CGMCC 1.16607 TaxID=3351842 RepID=UPI003643BF8A
MIDLNIFDLYFNRIGEISEYKSLSIERNYTKVSQLILRVAGSRKMTKLLAHNNIITTIDNVNYGYIIEHFDYVDEGGSEIEIIAYSLNYMLSWRSIDTQQRFVGNVEDMVKYFVNRNAINPINLNRIIPNLRLAPNSGINITDESTKTGGEVVEHCFSICNKYEMTFDILLNHNDKKFDVYTWQGTDRSTQQSINPHVIFSKEFDNVLKQNYVHGLTDYKTTAIVAGEGEGLDRKYVIANDHFVGFNRREVYIDARDLQSEYKDENDNDKIMTPNEYKIVLENRGIEKLADYKAIETFESEIDMYSQFKYGVDYGLGDVVSVRNDEISRIMHTRITSAFLSVDENKVRELKVAFGSNIPTLVEKIRKKVS